MCISKPGPKMHSVTKTTINVKVIGCLVVGASLFFLLICYLSFDSEFFTQSRGLQVDEKPRMVKILCYGDSLTAGFYFRGQKFFPYAKTLKVTLQHLVKGLISTFYLLLKSTYVSNLQSCETFVV